MQCKTSRYQWAYTQLHIILTIRSVSKLVTHIAYIVLSTISIWCIIFVGHTTVITITVSWASTDKLNKLIFILI